MKKIMLLLISVILVGCSAKAETKKYEKILNNIPIAYINEANVRKYNKQNLPKVISITITSLEEIEIKDTDVIAEIDLSLCDKNINVCECSVISKFNDDVKCQDCDIEIRPKTVQIEFIKE